ncbi:hypothetical protein ABKN59_011052 [Abortiporus biennis]
MKIQLIRIVLRSRMPRLIENDFSLPAFAICINMCYVDMSVREDEELFGTLKARLRLSGSTVYNPKLSTSTHATATTNHHLQNHTVHTQLSMAIIMARCTQGSRGRTKQCVTDFECNSKTGSLQWRYYCQEEDRRSLGNLILICVRFLTSGAFTKAFVAIDLMEWYTHILVFPKGVYLKLKWPIKIASSSRLIISVYSDCSTVELGLHCRT